MTNRSKRKRKGVKGVNSRKGMNSRKRCAQRKRKVVLGLRRLLPVIGVAAAAITLVGLIVYGGLFSYGKAVGVIDRSRLFTVGRISVKGNERIATNEIVKRCGIARSEKIYRIEKDTVTAALLGDPWIEKVRCVTRWWGTVALEIKERVPIALVNVGEMRLIDRNGVLLPIEPGKSYDLPLISGLPITVDGKGQRRPDSASVGRAARFIENVQAVEKTFFRTIAQIDIRDTGCVRCLAADRPAVIEIPYDADVKQIRNLRYLLETLTGNASVATRIDLRYQNLAFVSREPSETNRRRDTGK